MECANCGIHLNDDMDYCHSCGGKVVRQRLTMRHLSQHFAETFLNYDNKFLQTFIGLFTKPEVVIMSYIDGCRKKYVNVITYFAIALTLSGIHIFIMNKFFPEAMNMDVFFTEGAEEYQRKGMSVTQEYQSLLYMLFAPLYALISRLVFWNKKNFNYTEHVVINMYLLAQLSILSVITTFFTTLIGIKYASLVILILIFQTIYSAYVFKRLYQLTMGSIILKYLLFLLVAIILFIFISILSAIYMFINGDFQSMTK